MRSRNKNQSSEMEGTMNALCNEESETLAATSRRSVERLVKRVIACNSTTKIHDCFGQGSMLKGDGKRAVEPRVTWNDVDGRGCSRDPVSNHPGSADGTTFCNTHDDSNDTADDVEWEDGSVPTKIAIPKDGVRDLTIELSDSPVSVRRKTIRRATAEDKEVAELVHKVHLLCLLARGRMVDSACDNPLIQASILSLLPKHFLKIAEVPKLTADALSPIVHWFHNNFRARISVSEHRSFSLALAFALETQEGTPEEIAALFVALLRALKLTTRFVSVLDVASIKPNLDRGESSRQGAVGARRGVFNTSTLMVDRSNEVSTSPLRAFSADESTKLCKTSLKNSCQSKDHGLRISRIQPKDAPVSIQVPVPALESEAERGAGVSKRCCPTKCAGSKRKGDLEHEMQMEMAISATAIESAQASFDLDVKVASSSSSNAPPLKITRRVRTEESLSHGISTAVGSKKVGSPLYWAEVYCDGENLAGKWVHVDTVNAIIDGEQKVEAAVAACKTSLRYVVAFANHGVKDVTRRYCMKWHRIASERINPVWWNSVLAPFRRLESRATGGFMELSGEPGRNGATESFERNSFAITRETLEDMELETRALTEPLPTNQQAYRNHQLYAIERWLTETQVLHPKGPILGICSGYPVYPRECVQALKTKERWLREGLQVKANELPAKVLKQKSKKLQKMKFLEDDEHNYVHESKGSVELYGKWQLEPLQLPHAVNGIVPKNERGQVDVWSEKCLPPGTVHIRLPRVFNIAKRLELDYAPAMVGFEYKGGRSYPVFDGIVVCTEFKNVILEAYAEEEERREAEEKRRNEAQALSRWYQLLSSIITRQRLNSRYGSNLSSKISSGVQNGSKIPEIEIDRKPHSQAQGFSKQSMQTARMNGSLSQPRIEDHEHVFLLEDQTYNDSSLRTKRCYCGFSIQVEELL